jgi:hypothetical protein
MPSDVASHLKELWVGFRDEWGTKASPPDQIVGIEEFSDPDAPPPAITKEGVSRLKAMMPSLRRVYH